jgi:membrane protein
MLHRLRSLPLVGDPLYIFVHSILEMSEKDGFEISGYIAYSAMFALFPFLIFLTSLGAVLGSDQAAQSFIDNIVIYLPKDVSNTLVPVVKQVISAPRGGLLTLGLLTSIWSAASGVDALRMALNRAYLARESRHYVWRKAQSILFVFGGVVVAFAVSILIILGPYVLGILRYLISLIGRAGHFSPLIEKYLPLIDDNAAIWHVGRYVVGLLLLTGALVLSHRWLPNRRLAWRDIIPGAAFTTILWIVSATAFSYYLGKFAHYGATYGSLGGVIVTLLFFYLTAVVFILGGEVNATVWHRRYPAETESPAELL